MRFIMRFIINLIYNIFDFLILHRYLKSFLTISSKKTNFINIAVYLVCIFLLSSINTKENPNLNLICSAFCIFLYSYTFNFSFKNIFLPLCLYIGLGFVVEPLGFLINMYLLESEVFVYLSYVIAMVISLIVRFLMFEVVRRYRKIRMSSVPFSISVLLIGVLMLGIFECCIAITMSWYYDSRLTNAYALIVVIAVLLINILEFWILEKYQVLSDQTHDNELMLQEAHAKESYYHEIEESNNEIRKIRHDLKNRLIGIVLITDIVQKNNSINSIINELGNADKKIYTSNTVINTILNTKLGNVDNKIIQCDIHVSVPKHINMDYGDAGILYGNLLDNAIEACKKLPPEKQWIKIKIIYQLNSLLVNISNSKSQDEGMLLSKKRNAKEHGFGLKSVYGIVEKYNGTVEVLNKSNSFEVSALLYGIKMIE